VKLYVQINKMPNTTLYKYRYYSFSDSNFHTEWLENKPQGSNIDPVSVTVIDQISQDLVQIRNDYNKTGGNYMLEGWNVQIPAQSNYDYFKMYPMGISCYNVYCYPTQSNVGDSFSCYCPLPTVPVVGQVLPGSSNIPVPGAIIPYINVGFNVALSNANGFEKLGHVININTSNNTITTEIASSNTYTYPDQVVTRSYFVDNLTIPVVTRFTVGEGTLNGTYVPANTPVYVEYKNNDSKEKTMTFHIEYMY
jgi:hypothetical protein